MKDDGGDQLLHALCKEARDLLSTLTGPVKSVSVQAGDHRVEIEWDRSTTTGVPAVATVGPGPALAEPAGVADVPGRHVVTAPLVGTFYRASEPGAPPFVDVGAVVEAEQTIAIIEAMKIMNAIPCEVGGRVSAILVENGVIVEFGQPLMYIDPLGDED